MKSLSKSIKSRIQLAFLLLSIGSILLFSLFSLVFFYQSIRSEAIENMGTKNDVFSELYQSKLNTIESFATSLVNDRAITVPLTLDIRHTLSDYVQEIVEREGDYHITIINSQGQQYVDVGLTGSAVMQGGRQESTDELQLYSRLADGESVLSAVLLTNGDDEAHPALAAAVPVFRDGSFAGGICVYYVLRDNPELMWEFKNILNVETVYYYNFEPVISTVDLEIDERTYIDNTFIENRNDINFRLLEGINTYIPIINFRNEPVGLVRLYHSPTRFLNMFFTALSVYSIFALIIIIFSIFIVLRVSNSILKPLKTLMGGVNRITEGDLTFEIMLTVKDEIGSLGKAFNEMRESLNEKINTIEALNRGLEEKVEERTKQINELNSKMKNYLSPQLYKSIVFGQRDSSRERHYRKKLTVFFSDIVGFTRITEMMEPEEISRMLNTYLDEMTNIAIKYEGTIDKFVGDAIMVFFGDPEFVSDKVHALRAVKMALEMQDILEDLRVQWEKEGYMNPFHVRMGVNTGYCTIGNFGAESKMDYTIIGNNVNMASRFETMAKPDSILISPESYTLVKDEIECKLIGEAELKGIPHPVKVYQPLRLKGKDTQIQYLKVSKKKILLKNQLLNMEELAAEEQEKLEKELKKALYVVQSKKIQQPSKDAEPEPPTPDAQEKDDDHKPYTPQGEVEV
ncbi:MAG: adenylate/guanylate cyclase domain-containing protein [Spirochaetia bacterium]